MRILTGIQPSGDLHIGNYFGAIKPMVDYMNNSQDEIFCFIADYHALTTLRDAKQLRENVRKTMLDWIACGLDPEKINFYVQSDIPEVHELAWHLHSICPMGLLERGVSYRDKVENGINAHSALFNYPVLMAADILIMQADLVPVGRDQKQHIEITRDLAIKFNYEYGETFKVPEEFTEKEVAVIPGTDGRKMSKSYNNYIPLFAPEKQIRKKVMAIVTDSKGVDEKKDPEKCNVFALYKLFASKEEQNSFASKYRAGSIGYGEAKEELFLKIKSYFQEAWKKREALEYSDNLDELRLMGREKVNKIVRKTMEKARKKVGLR